MKVREVLRLLHGDGWAIVRQKGSHRQLAHPRKRGLVTVAGKLSDDQHPPPGRTETMKYLIVIEKTKTGFSAYSPDLPGCVATGATRKRTESTMRAAIAFHIEGMRAERMRVPPPLTYSTYVDVPA